MFSVMVLAIAAVIVGGYYYPKYKQTVVVGAVGDTQGTPKMVQVQCDPTTPTYNSTDNKYQYCSITNSNGTDRTINSVEYFWSSVQNTAVSTSTGNRFNTIIATTTAASSGYGTNVNYVLIQGVATSGPAVVYNASTTPGTTSLDGARDFVRVWAAGTVLVFEGTATTTGSLWLKVTYIQQ